MKFKITRKDQDIIASVMVFKEKWWLWVINVKNLLRFGLPVVLGVVLMASYFSSRSVKSGEDFIVADQAFDQWSGGDDSKLNDLEKLMSHHPELHAKYDSAIASHLAAMENGAKAKSYAQKVFQRINGVCEFHGAFANTSLQILEGQYNEALNMAKALKQELEAQDLGYSKLLYGYNLLRIASLEKQLENHGSHKQALDNLRSFLVKNKGKISFGHNFF